MTPIVLNARYPVKQRLLTTLRRCRDAGTRQRSLIMVNLLNGRSVPVTAAVLHVHRTTVYRVAGRFRAYGEAGLCDGRADNGVEKLSEHYLKELDRVVRGSPQDYGWHRPTWTRELLVETLVRQKGGRVEPAALSSALAEINARA